jgi:hypothetical protein
MVRAPTGSLESRSSAARELAVLWRRIGSQHLSAAQGCACGFGGLMIQAADFEIDIVEFVLGDAQKSNMRGVEGYIKAVAGRGDDRYSLPALLDAIGKAGGDAQASPDELEFILTRLRTTLTNIEAAHNNSRFVCD